MYRRSFLGLVSGVSVTGCLGGDGEDDRPLTSEGNDDQPIEKPPEDLLLTAAQLDGSWQEQETDRDPCSAFWKSCDIGQVTLVTCAWVLTDNDEAQETFESRIRQSRTEVRSGVEDEEPEIGVEAAIVHGGTEIHVIFRDANGIGRVEYELDVHGMVSEDDIPESEDVLVHAAAMHRTWRD